MIVYRATKSRFVHDANTDDIEQIVRELFNKFVGHNPSESEVRSWRESLREMSKVLGDEAIPEEAGVAIEYGIPFTSKRIDMLISGRDAAARETLIVVELKQWESAHRTDLDGIVRTRFARGEAEVSHPSYQAWSYAELLRSFNEPIYKDDIPVLPCAYLHNCTDARDLEHPFYKAYCDAAPLFTKGLDERKRLREFIARHVRKGDSGELILKIEQGRVRPSKRLIDALDGMMAGRREFVLIDDQKLVYETALQRARAASADGPRQVVIVEGGPGTGKSVVAINLLASINREERLARYVTKNRAPRQVFEEQLSGALRRSKIQILFAGSGEFVGAAAKEFDTLLVDEAHRLNEKSGLFANLGENQIKEIIHASRCSIFFIDEDQRVTWKDIGRISEIESWARRVDRNVEITRLALQSQFRCSGSDGYLAWLDDVLGIRPTANGGVLDPADFDFQVFDSPNALRDVIRRLNDPGKSEPGRVANRARMVAGYCWDWKSKTDRSKDDVVIPQHSFAMQWNFASDQGLWITAPHSVEQIGCIHTCQGLEVDYIGVIVGADLVVRGGEVVTQPAERSRQDQSIKGFKAALRKNAVEARRKADEIIKNTYRTLMTRGLKGCYVYFVDAETARYFKARIGERVAPPELEKVAEMSGIYSTKPSASGEYEK